MNSGKIFCLIGKSCTGKDTVYSELLSDDRLALLPLVLYTTRPMREGETDGKQYHFITGQQWEALPHRLIEARIYNTAHGKWRYGTFDDGSVPRERDALCIATLEMLPNYKKYYGAERVVPLYLEAGNKTRLQRAVQREPESGNFDEVCRRYLADEADFSPQELARHGIDTRYINDDLQKCLAEVKSAIRGCL